MSLRSVESPALQHGVHTLLLPVKEGRGLALGREMITLFSLIHYN
jgi:hypothetical protein